MALVVSSDQGQTWAPLAAPSTASHTPGRFAHARSLGVLEVAESASVRFGLRLAAPMGAGSPTLDEATCRLQVRVGP
jgi:hypothetical protein